MSEVRVIKFNEELFKIPNGTQRKRPDKPIRVKAPRKVSDKTLRNRVLNEIRKNQEKQYHTMLDTSTSDSAGANKSTDAFNSDFNQSLEYMKQLAGKVKEEEKAKNTTLKSTSGLANTTINTQTIIPETNLINVNLDSVDPSPVVLKPAPPVPYGCLKVGGTLPTYRTYHNTLAKHNQETKPIQQQVVKPVVAERIISPTEIAMHEKAKIELIEKSKPKHKKIKKLLRRTYRAGKDKHKPRVGVLLPNKTIRTNITPKAYLLKQTPIEEIRKHLIKKGFIKHGSSAPNDVLRKIYESVQMIGGEISNYNPDNLLYNFFTDKE